MIARPPGMSSSRTTVIAVALAAAALLMGCTKTYQKSELIRKAERLQPMKLPDVYYVGSDARYDYFQWFLGNARVRREEGLVADRMPRTNDSSQWRHFRQDVRPEMTGTGEWRVE